MAKTSASIQKSDIEDFPEHDAEFQALLKYVRELGFPVIRERSVEPAFLKMVDLFHWRAYDGYFVFKAGQKIRIPAHDIYHPAIHSLLARKFGKKLKARPHFTILSECIATAAEFYFTLTNLAARGPRRTDQLYLHHCVTAQGDAKSVQRVVKSALRDPFRAFQESVQEGLEFYEALYSLGVKRVQGAGVDPKVLRSFAKRRGKYLFVFLRYNFANNVNYVLANSGARSSAEDRKAVKECLRLLKGSKDLQDFLKHLGLRS
jgi:hypothetical protein